MRVGGVNDGEFRQVETVLDETSGMMVATGVLNIWSAPAADVAQSFHRPESRHPAGFLLGLGVGHVETNGAAYVRPYDAMRSYHVALDLVMPPDADPLLGFALFIDTLAR